MEEAVFLQTSPPASVERVVVEKMKGRGDETAVFAGAHPDQPVAHPLAEEAEEGRREIGGPPAAVDRAEIEGMKTLELARVELLAGADLDLELRAPQLSALAADGLAAAASEPLEEVFEIAIAAIEPAIADAAADEPSGLGEQIRLALFTEGDMHRGKPEFGAQPLERPDDPGSQRLWSQQARPGDGGEGDGGLKLGVVAAAEAGLGLGPAVVEDILPPGVALEVERYGTRRRGGRAEHEVEGLPARLRPHRTAFLEQSEIAVRGEGVAGGLKRVPGRLRNLRDRAAGMRPRLPHLRRPRRSPPPPPPHRAAGSGNPRRNAHGVPRRRIPPP